MLKRLFILSAVLLVCAALSNAQGIRFGDNFNVTSVLTTPGPISTVPTSTINICTSPANAVPCTNKATTYTSVTLSTPCLTSTQLVLAGTSTCVAQTDSRGNWGVWVAQGTYDFTITVSTGQSFGPYTVSAGYAGAVLLGANNTFSGNNTFTQLLNLNAGITSAGPNTLNGTTTVATILAQNINAQVWASQYAGATCGDKINTVMGAVPSTPSGILVHINNACGMGTAGAPWAAVTTAVAGNVILEFDEPGIYWLTSIDIAGPNSGIISKFPCPLAIGGQQNCPISLKVGNAKNPAYGIRLDGSQDFVMGVVVDGNKANNPTEGVGVMCNKANRCFLGFGSTQNFASHGIWSFSTLLGGEAGSGSVTQWTSTLNNGDAVFGQNSGDWFFGEESAFELNGNSATVNTTNTSITATAGSWSTDSSLVGTMLRVNNSVMCQVLAIPSTTTITVAAATCFSAATGVSGTALGTLTGVPLAWGVGGIEAQNFPTIRVDHVEMGSNGQMGGNLIYGTSTGIGSNSEMFTSSAIGNSFQHNIEILGSCIDSQGTACSMGNIIVGNRFWKGNQAVTANTYDKIKLVDGGQNIIQGNYFNPSAGASQEKAAIEAVESTAGRMVANSINGNSLGPTAWGTNAYVDTTFSGGFGFQVQTNSAGGSNDTLDIFDASTGASTPHKRFRTSGGNLQIFNNAFTQIGTWTDAGQFSAIGPVLEVGTACTNGELALSAGWQSTGSATVTAVAGNGQTCSWTITTGTTTAANPTVTDTLTNVLPNATTVCEMSIHGGTGATAATMYFLQTALSATAPIFTFQGTPTAGGTTYFVTRRCGP